MFLLSVLAIVGTVLGFVLLTLCIAAGLVHVSEFIEEHTQLARRLLQRTIWAEMGFLTALWIIDRLPFWLVLLSVFSHWVYSLHLKTFPLIPMLSPLSLLSLVLVVANHILWFRHFNALNRDAMLYGTPGTPYGNVADDPAVSFRQVASFFSICVWLVPCVLFVSVSTGEMSLPIIGSDGVRVAPDASAQRTPGLVKQLYQHMGERVERLLEAMGWDERGLSRAGRFV